MHPSSLKTLKYFATAHPGRTAMMVASLTAAGAVEGIGAVTLLPLITIITKQNGLAPVQLETMIRTLFGLLHIPVSLVTLLGFVVLTTLTKAAMTMLAMNQVAWAAPRVGSELRLGLLHAVLNARWAHLTGLSSGASANAIGTEALRAIDVYRQACTILAYAILIVVYTGLALAVSWQITIAAVIASFTIALTLHPFVHWARKSGQAQTRLYAESLQHLANVVTGIKPVKAMAREESYRHMLEGLTKKLEKAQRHQILNEQALLQMNDPLMVVFLAIGIYIVMTYTSMAAGEILFLAYLFSRLVARTMNAQRMYQNMVINESALWSLRGAIDEAERAAETFTGKKAPALKTAITLDRVSFAYGEHPVLTDAGVVFPVHKFHAVLGPSGSGKTTLIDLIIGLHRPQAGHVLVDGVPLDEIDIRAWRRMIGYVPQEVILFPDSIFYNVTMGEQDCTMADAERALKAAGAWDFVAAMPDGIAAPVGERGLKLSGGQRQRIAIARAIVHNPALLILDEATSALDAPTEEALLKTVRELSQRMTIIAISHKESIRALADQVFEFENGQVLSRTPSSSAVKRRITT